MIIGTYSGGSASAYEYTTIDELLSQLPDNTANQIDAINVRNSVYTLWERISDVQTVASQSASASVLYTNLTPVPLAVGGIGKGSTFSNRTMQEMWDALLYPYIGPVASISSPSLNPREFGSSNQVTLNYSVTKNSNNITSIVLSGSNGYNFAVPGAPFTTNTSGSQVTNATQNVNTSFTVTANDGTSTSSSSLTIVWLNAVYWGRNSSFSLPSMSIPSLSTKPTWADGAGIGSGKTLASGRSGNYSGINGAGQYLVFAWPSSFGNPSFTINGLPNTAFTKIGSGVPHTNMNGFGPVNYDVWISNTAQNSPIASFVIS